MLQIMMAMLHSNGQQRIEKDRDTEKRCQKPVLQQQTTDDRALHRKLK